MKKTELKAYSRPLKSGIIAIKLREDDELVDVVVTKPGDEVVLATAARHGDPLQRGRRPPDGPQHQRREGHLASARTTTLVGMVVADPDATLLTACENGYGKRTPFGPNAEPGDESAPAMPTARRRQPPAPPGVLPNRETPKTKPPPPSATAPRTAAARASATSRPPTATAR